jgi:hypothetical protein
VPRPPEREHQVFTDEVLLLFVQGCRLAAEMGEDECFLSTPRYYEYLGIAKRLNISLLQLGCWCNIDGVLDPLLDTKPASYWENMPVLQQMWPVL